MQTNTPPPAITSDVDLTNLVSDLAQKQILIERAKGQVQATVEAAKLAFDEGTREIMTEIALGFQAINEYCAANRDRLFPVKNGKRQKTYAVLQHKLQFRSSSEVTAPADVLTRIQERLVELQTESRSMTLTSDQREAVLFEINLLLALIRQPAPELNKDAAGGALANETTALTLAPLGISLTTNETFKLVFTLTPGS